MRQLPALAALALWAVAAGGAHAQEVIATGASGDPPKAEPAAPPTASPAPGDTDDPEAIGRWANAVLAGAPTATPLEARGAETGRCAAPADGRPHGEVWAGVGTGGYREIGAVVTQPVGKCGSVTIAVSKTEGRVGRRPHRLR